jgi:hypothetical protein
MQINQSTVEKMAGRMQLQASTIGKFQAGLVFEPAFASIQDSLHRDAG